MKKPFIGSEEEDLGNHFQGLLRRFKPSQTKTELKQGSGNG